MPLFEVVFRPADGARCWSEFTLLSGVVIADDADEARKKAEKHVPAGYKIVGAAIKTHCRPGRKRKEWK